MEWDVETSSRSEDKFYLLDRTLLFFFVFSFRLSGLRCVPVNYVLGYLLTSFSLDVGKMLN